MPTVLRRERLRFAIYPNDHPPAHVRVIGPGWVMVVNLLGPKVREAIGCSEPEARHVLRLVAEHREPLPDAWRRIRACPDLDLFFRAVMAGLVPAIHVFGPHCRRARKSYMPMLIPGSVRGQA